MKKEIHYCDRCGTQLSYQDADGDMCVQSIKLSAPVTVVVAMRTDCGSSSSQKQTHGTEFCSVDCFIASVDTLKAQVMLAAVDMQPVKEML